jgi:hypothetical protein
MSLTGFHPSWHKTLSQNLQAVADQGCHLGGSSPYKEPLIRGYIVLDSWPVTPKNIMSSHHARKARPTSHVSTTTTAVEISTPLPPLRIFLTASIKSDSLLEVFTVSNIYIFLIF